MAGNLGFLSASVDLFLTVEFHHILCIISSLPWSYRAVILSFNCTLGSPADLFKLSLLKVGPRNEYIKALLWFRRAAKVEKPCETPTRVLPVAPRKTGCGALKMSWVGLPALFPGSSLFCTKMARTQPHPQNQTLRHSCPNFTTKFLKVNKLKQKQAPSEGQKTRSRSQ